jgi:hypothetical protein
MGDGEQEEIISTMPRKTDKNIMVKLLYIKVTS